MAGVEPRGERRRLRPDDGRLVRGRRSRARIRAAAAEFEPDHVLLSFHGVPERHVRRTDRAPQPRCLVQARRAGVGEGPEGRLELLIRHGSPTSSRTVGSAISSCRAW